MSEGVVALLEPFIDTIIICSMTGLVLVTTGVWHERTPTELSVTGGDSSYVVLNDKGRYTPVEPPAELRVEDGRVVNAKGAFAVRYAWHDVPVQRLYTDEAETKPFSGVLLPAGCWSTT